MPQREQDIRMRIQKRKQRRIVLYINQTLKMNATQGVPVGTAAWDTEERRPDDLRASTAPAGAVRPRTFVLRVNPRIGIFLFCIATSLLTHNPGIGISVLILFWLCFGWPTQDEIVLMRMEY